MVIFARAGGISLSAHTTIFVEGSEMAGEERKLEVDELQTAAILAQQEWLRKQQAALVVVIGEIRALKGHYQARQEHRQKMQLKGPALSQIIQEAEAGSRELEELLKTTTDETGKQATEQPAHLAQQPPDTLQPADDTAPQEETEAA